MATGSVVGFQGCVPLEGESTITQKTAATDLLTLKLATSGTGDFLVFTDSAGSELGCFTSSGVFVASTISGVGAQTVGSTLTVTGACSLNSSVTVSKDLNASSSVLVTGLASLASQLTVTKSASFASSVGFNGATPIGKSAVGAAASTSTGASGADSTGNYLTVVNLVNSIRAALISVGLVTT